MGSQPGRFALRSLTFLFVAMLGLLGSTAVTGQDSFDASAFDQSGDVFGGISFGGLGDTQQEPVTWDARYYVSGSKATLQIEASVGNSWHIYSTTQPPGGPLPTKFTIAAPKTVSLAGKFKPNEPPAKSVSEIYPGVTIEEHDGVVVWSAPLSVSAGFKGDIKIAVDALVCQTGGSCMPAKTTLTAKFAGPLQDAGGNASTNSKATEVQQSKTPAQQLVATGAKPATFRDKDYEVTWKAGVSKSIAAGGRGHLIFQARPEADYHVYKGVVDDAESSTNFVITEKSGLLVGSPVPDQPIISKSLFAAIPGLPAAPPVEYHEGNVTWSLPIRVPEGTAEGNHEIKGFVCYQACTDKSCLQPMAMEFVATVSVSKTDDPTIAPLQIKTAKFRSAIDLAAETDWVDASVDNQVDTVPDKTPSTQVDSAPDEQPDAKTDDSDAGTVMPEVAAGSQGSDGQGSDDQADLAAAAGNEELPKASFPFILLMALAGGLILNLMPCVLPVIGLKIMSFVQQAGEDRKRIFLLNFAYVAGIMTVFFGLAMLAVVWSFGWGQQFAYFPVRIGLTVMIFALALSYLGVWELPTPSFATGKSSDDLQSKEGLAGAFFTGAFATVLATPCSGPFLGVALGYTIYLNSVQSAIVIMTVGLGMSLPYILLGLFPSAIGFLPKPGNWMVTLKEFLAFLFLGTVAYFFNQFSDEQKLPVFVTLIGVWFGCWIIGKVPPWETIGKRLRGWSIGVGSAVAIGWLGFAYLEDNPEPAFGNGSVQYIVDDHVRWEKFDEQRLQEHQLAGRTVMLDFTAAWCPNCILNTQIALDTEPTNELLEELDAIPMLADMTDLPEDIVTKLENEFGSKSIPLLAIYPGDSPDDPIVLRDIVTQSMVLDALKQAGPSKGGSTVAGRSKTSKSLTAERLTSASPGAPVSVASQSH